MLAEMSSRGNLCTPEYQSSAVSIAKEHADFILGFIAMKPVSEGFLTLTPGVQMKSKGDGLGQVYREPRDVVKGGSDVIIVGRGITGAKDIQATAALYQKEGWEGYLDRLNYILAGDLFHRPNQFQDRVAGSCTNVELVGIPTRQQVLHCQDVRLGKIVHVDVVADAGAVRGIVIVAEDGDRLAGHHCIEHQRNQVGLRLVLLSKPALGIGARGVEVSQRDVGDPMDHRTTAAASPPSL